MVEIRRSQPNLIGSVVKPGRGIFGLIAKISVNGMAIVLIGAGKETIVLIRIIFAIVIVVVFRS